MVVISGGQTGVDLAAIDAAKACGIKFCGYAPDNMRNESGPVPTGLVRFPGGSYRDRTIKNVELADRVIVIRGAEIGRGTGLTMSSAKRLHKPLLVIDPRGKVCLSTISQFMSGAEYVMVAGPRESGSPGIYTKARSLLERAFDFHLKC